MAYKDPEDQKKYRAEWHAKNYKGKYAKAHRQKVRDRRAAIKEFIKNYKAERGCARCLERDPACLDPHHVDGKKERSLSVAAIYGWSLERITTELKKCEILCANCHRKHHAGVA